MARFEDLSSELILLILSHLKTKSEIINFAIVCKAFQALATPSIYRSYRSTPSWRCLPRLIETLRGHPEYCELMYHVELFDWQASLPQFLRPSQRGNRERGRRANRLAVPMPASPDALIPDLLLQLPKLTHLTLWWPSKDSFTVENMLLTAVSCNNLGRLKCLHIRPGLGTPAPTFLATTLAAVIYLPSLEKVILETKIRNDSNNPRLIGEPCNLRSLKIFRRVRGRFPTFTRQRLLDSCKSLKSFEYVHTVADSTDWQVADWTGQLKAAKSTLRDLTLHQSPSAPISVYEDFRQYEAIENLDLSESYFNISTLPPEWEDARRDRRLESIRTKIQQFPPYLQVLRLHECTGNYTSVLLYYIARYRSEGFHSQLKRLVVVMCDTMPGMQIWAETFHRLGIESRFETLLGQHIHFVVGVESISGDALFMNAAEPWHSTLLTPSFMRDTISALFDSFNIAVNGFLDPMEEWKKRQELQNG